MDEEQRLKVAMIRYRSLHICGAERHTPRFFYMGHLQSKSPGDVNQPAAEDAIVEHQDSISFCEQAIDDRIVGGVSGSDEEHHVPDSPHDLLNVFYRFIEYFNPAITVMGCQRIAHPSENFRLHFYWSGDHQSVIFSHVPFLDTLKCEA